MTQTQRRHTSAATLPQHLTKVWPMTINRIAPVRYTGRRPRHRPSVRASIHTTTDDKPSGIRGEAMRAGGVSMEDAVSSSFRTLPSRGARSIAFALISAAMLALLLSACDSGTTSTNNQTVTNPALAQIPWCDQPSIQFQDDSTTQQTVLSDWSKVKDQLNFTPYLPPTLPAGSCLVLAGGTIHDPIYGARLSITYDLPNSVPLSFSEAPKRANLSETLQCQASTTDATTSICIGAVANTTVTIAARQVESDVQNLFKTLQPNVDWVPATSATATPAASTTPGAATPSATASK